MDHGAASPHEPSEDLLSSTQQVFVLSRFDDEWYERPIAIES